MPYIDKSKTNNWGTPKELYKELDQEFHFDHDPCPHLYEQDGLKSNWGKSNFVNPPYDNIKAWAKKCRDEQIKGNKSVLLIPPRTDTKYFHEYILPFTEIRFIKGRLKFTSLDDKSKKSSPSPFPSILCIYK